MHNCRTRSGGADKQGYDKAQAGKNHPGKGCDAGDDQRAQPHRNHRIPGEFALTRDKLIQAAAQPVARYRPAAKHYQRQQGQKRQRKQGKADGDRQDGCQNSRSHNSDRSSGETERGLLFRGLGNCFHLLGEQPVKQQNKSSDKQRPQKGLHQLSENYKEPGRPIGSRLGTRRLCPFLCRLLRCLAKQLDLVLGSFSWSSSFDALRNRWIRLFGRVR